MALKGFLYHGASRNFEVSAEAFGSSGKLRNFNCLLRLPYDIAHTLSLTHRENRQG
ncbi:uncharacterized protein PHALS_07123 [Plasmopara halstedii]|uniref:Uncharacterized protein n=1 Tax=Plasmopara halstedii TaxID=4781 RepID=A0A0P1B4V9_PLAHL|nr:uncharacterized protein PHALS_07123 [Plasmopara halstedii]CEG49358.1 hypothetical protein PHALS_07123 [Plasmopara halstedii]|eukprot:XP_024585727.1 hypothetical protein PHALS_07123 [Plasmopara halstedii]